MDGEAAAMINSTRTKFLVGSTIVGSIALITGCVSVSVSGGPKIKKSDTVSYAQPPSPFSIVQLEAADKAWQNKKNGNTISYNSSCNDPADPPIEAAKNDLLSNLDDLKVLSEQDGMFDDRQSLTTIAEGNVDGVKTQIELLVFKKNNCLYSLSYVGLNKSFSENVAQYRAFVQSFKAQ